MNATVIMRPAAVAVATSTVAATRVAEASVAGNAIAVVAAIEQGLRGEPGENATPQIAVFQLDAVASFAAAHAFPYVPDVRLTLPSGELVDTDVVHAPGKVFLTFASPFTGSLTLA